MSIRSPWKAFVWLLIGWAVVKVVDGLAAVVVTPKSPKVVGDPKKDVLHRWLGIVQHLQNPNLYNAQAWADKAILSTGDNIDDPNNNYMLVANQNVTIGEVLSLVPIDRLDLVVVDDMPKNRDIEKRKPINKPDGTSSYTFTTNLTRPHEYHRAAGISQDMQIRVYPPNKTNVQEIPPGWRGHLATDKNKDLASGRCILYNCCVVPLLGAMPLCALVATQNITAGTRLIAVQQENNNTADLVEQLALLVLKRHLAEIMELRSFTTMAHPFPTYNPPPVTESLRQEFHAIDDTYPGLRVLYKNPCVLSIDNFLSTSECQTIIDYARPRLAPCLVKNAETGHVETDRTRTSTNANIPQSAIPTVTTKVRRLLQAPTTNHLEIFQVLRYTPGQVFLPHTDGFVGPIDACGFDQSGRLVTMFCYLNSCLSGGATRFGQLPVVDGTNDFLMVTPMQGQAVIHFPNTLTLQEDTRTEHESLPVEQGEKWLLVCWCWQHARSNPAYHEALIE
jgi:prolyl 4-hydroxylase